MSVTILRSGMLDTIQDEGRLGHAELGINYNGAMDPYAMKIANYLVGNDKTKAVIEIHFPGPQLLFEQNALISLTGADFLPTINGDPVQTWKPIVIRKNSILQFTHRQAGARAYLAVHGGFCTRKWLNSYSTNLKANAGGWFGRKLEKADEIPFGETDFYFAGLLKEGNPVRELNWSIDYFANYNHPFEIGFMRGREWDLLTEESKERMLQENFYIHPSSDRMGYNLRGPAIELKQNFQLVSSAVSFGTLQLLPNNQLIVLMADHQTTGGYPRIGHVISAHLCKLAQLSASESFKLNLVEMKEAERLLFAQRQDLQLIKSACEQKIKQVV